MLLKINDDIETKETKPRDLFKYLHRKLWYDSFTIADLDNPVTLKSIINKGE